MEHIELERKIEAEKDKLDKLSQVIGELTDTHFHALATNRIDDLPILEDKFRHKMDESRLIRESISRLETILAVATAKGNVVCQNIHREEQGKEIAA
jgi:hypothetical protein